MKKIAISLLFALLFLGVFVTVIYAVQNVTIKASVPPYYEVHPRENELYIETNMKVIINGKKVAD